MTPHDHTTFVPGCFRCELGRDEVADQGTGLWCPDCGAELVEVDDFPEPFLRCEPCNREFSYDDMEADMSAVLRSHGHGDAA